MNFQQLEYIVTLDSLKSFSKAAKVCHVTQATLSAMVKKLEEELGIILFDRKTNPILTTDCGKEIVLEAKKILLQAERLKDISQEIQHKIEGKVRIGIIPTIASSLLPKILSIILKKYPLLQLEIKEMITETIISQLKEGNLDVGILATPLQKDEIEEEILYYETLMIYGDMNEKKQYIAPEQLQNYKIWLLEEGNCLREQAIELCQLQESAEIPKNLTFEANSFDTLLNIVDEFGGLTLIPELYYQRLPQERKRKVSFFQTPIPVREVSLVYYRPYAKLRIVKMLQEEIKTHITSTLISAKYKKNELTILHI
ncbi:MAG: LysR substrate-binding domain-containing protein [Thermonemataceae bacterium]|nr:LysR substrate-binding domain-containing protein [Thermonemataceae bacterium]